MSIVERLKKHMKEKKMSLRAVASATGIPYARMHKWIAYNAQPKSEDTIILQDYLDGKKLNVLNEDQSKYTLESSLPQQNNCMETLAKAMEVILSQQKTIENLIGGMQAKPNVVSG